MSPRRTAGAELCTVSSGRAVVVSSSSELTSVGCCVFCPKSLLPIAVCNYYKQKGREKEHEHYQSKYDSKWIPHLHAKSFLGLAITFLLSTGNEINEKQKMLEIWCCVVFALFLSENFPRRAENQRLRWCCCREATWNRVLKTGTRGGKTARGISVPHTETRAKKLCFCCQVHCSYTCSFFSPHPNNSFPTEFPNTK